MMTPCALELPYVGFSLILWTAAALSVLCSASGQQYVRGSYGPSYKYQDPNSMALAAYQKLQNSPIWSADWGVGMDLGQVSAVSVDRQGQVLVFHRADRTWDASSFDFQNRYRGPKDPILDPSVLLLAANGTLLDMWGENMFYMPHGLTVDKEDNVWLTDVALHQVFKFTPTDHKRPALTLGVQFVPGDDEEHFCKPTSVAVLDSGDFFVADGYCNTRIIKYNGQGQKILQWGKDTAPSQTMPPPYSLFVPHALTLATEQGAVCVADRENGRVQCFNADNGTFHSQYHNWLIGSRVFSVAYSASNGGELYVVNGPTRTSRAHGFVIDMNSGKLVRWFGPPGVGLQNPHDIAVSPNGRDVYVAEIDPHKLHKFIEMNIVSYGNTILSNAVPKNDTKGVTKKMQEKEPTRVKPTATIEESSVVWRSVEARGAWLGVAGGAAGGLGAVLLCAVLAGIALLRARRTGWLKARNNRRRWDYAGGEFKLRRLLERPRGFQRVNTDESDEEPAPHTTMLQSSAPATA